MVLAGAVPAAAQAPKPNAELNRAWAAGYRAAFVCSSLWNGTGKPLDAIERDELTGIYPEIEADVRELKADVDDKTKTVSVKYRDDMPPRIAMWDSGEGCVTLPIGASAQMIPGFRNQGRPKLDDRAWPLGDKNALAPVARGAPRFADVGTNVGAFGGKTSALLIVRDGKIAFERYWLGHDLHTAQRTFSVAKSMAATLIGNAVHNGWIDVKAPAQIVEWQVPGDPRGAITTEQLMRMASGLTSDSAGNRSDAIYMGGSLVRPWTVQWPLLNPPGTRFRYANNDTLLAVLSLKAALYQGQRRVNEPTATVRFDTMLNPHRFFDRLGMTRTTAEHDRNGDYILSSQVWTTARDLARLGLLYQNDGMWQGERLLPADWRRFVTTPSGPQPDGAFGYGAGFWLLNKSEGIPADAFGAFGNRGQYLVVIPSRELVIVRQGYDDDKNRLDTAALVKAIVAADR
ncbi:CubicO group peptidase (beta-lactamase class C family) [Sphingopyxis sp. OAS728]|uniref:serine hydrolase domain-containing protein n=1 Tax=Sphingopyxis sp. OAS728 TaxID=2663823 RepID=UPI001A051438|nr:serine hydrolase [Sphingopyxis sp. OAS728]MBE1526781.1 CubicO group peptidase (beta-lactamase class C family) [Sphingopyxis sp. OAS728]